MRRQLVLKRIIELLDSISKCELHSEEGLSEKDTASIEELDTYWSGFSDGQVRLARKIIHIIEN